MIHTYKPTIDTKIAPHFTSNEFVCKCGSSHDTKLDDDLVTKLEKLRTKLDCSKIIINSGYRCSAHDKNVGGTGLGPHTKGVAADIKCYNKKGEVIDSRTVCCAAQEVGFNGIANIDKNYNATHVDVDSRKWYGDETVSTARSVTDDFHKYYKIQSLKKESKKVSLTIDGVSYSGILVED